MKYSNYAIISILLAYAVSVSAGIASGSTEDAILNIKNAELAEADIQNNLIKKYKEIDETIAILDVSKKNFTSSTKEFDLNSRDLVEMKKTINPELVAIKNKESKFNASNFDFEAKKKEVEAVKKIKNDQKTKLDADHIVFRKLIKNLFELNTTGKDCKKEQLEHDNFKKTLIKAEKEFNITESNLDSLEIELEKLGKKNDFNEIKSALKSKQKKIIETEANLITMKNKIDQDTAALVLEDERINNSTDLLNNLKNEIENLEKTLILKKYPAAAVLKVSASTNKSIMDSKEKRDIKTATTNPKKVIRIKTKNKVTAFEYFFFQRPWILGSLAVFSIGGAYLFIISNKVFKTDL